MLLLALIAALIWYANSAKKISPVRELAVAPETIGGFDVDGTGGDALLNREKNRYTTPLDIEDMTVAQIEAIPASVLDESERKKRMNWAGPAEDYVEKEERRGVRVTGYLIRAKESGDESCNGYSEALHDYHIWISDAPTSDKASGMIVEVTPRWKSVRPQWQLRTFEKLSNDHAKVRVTGWLMWDEEHPDEVGKSRGTQWEIHPVTNVEVYSGDNWLPIGTD